MVCKPVLELTTNDLNSSSLLDKNDAKTAENVFGGGRTTPEFTYLGAPIHTDFPLTYEALAPYVTNTLDQAAVIEATGFRVVLVEIKNGKVVV